jgi:ATP-dependent DNA helicase HFM1/MER3
MDCSVQGKNPIKLRFALELYQSIQAKIWSTSPYVARQIEGIGPQLARTLSQANLISMEQLKNCDPGRIEVVSTIITFSILLIHILC